MHGRWSWEEKTVYAKKKQNERVIRRCAAVSFTVRDTQPMGLRAVTGSIVGTFEVKLVIWIIRLFWGILGGRLVQEMSVRLK